jgi:hypothetical protein
MIVVIVSLLVLYVYVIIRALSIKSEFKVKVIEMPKGLYEIFKYPGDHYLIKYTTNGITWKYVKQTELPDEYPVKCVGKFTSDHIEKIMPLKSIEDIKELEKSLSRPTYEMIKEREYRRERKAQTESIKSKYNKQ